MGFKGEGNCIPGGFKSNFHTPSLNYPNKPLHENNLTVSGKVYSSAAKRIFQALGYIKI